MKGDKLLIEKKCKELGFELVENDFDYDKNRDAIFKVRCLKCFPFCIVRPVSSL